MTRKIFTLLPLFSIACNSRDVTKDGQCSTEEQNMFSECLSSGCSASYSQDLSGTDSCEFDASGSVVKVESGAECGFTSSGSCYVVCSCPNGVSAQFDVITETNQNTSQENQVSEVIDVTISLIMEKILLFESLINNLISASLISEEKDREIQNSIIELETEIDLRINNLLIIQEQEILRLENEISFLRNKILELELSNQQIQDDTLQALSEIQTLDTRITNIENTQLAFSEDILHLYDSVGLQISRYEVDCNSNNLAAIQTFLIGTARYQDRKCILVEGVDINNMPIISIAQNKTSWATDYFLAGISYSSWLDEFKVGIYDGGYSPGSGMPDDTYLGPGSSFRYDSITQQIYTAGHYKTSSTNIIPDIYIITVIGNQIFTSPY